MPNDRKPTLPTTAQSLPIALLRAREKVMAPIRSMLAQSGITEQQWRILRVLAEQGPMEPSVLASGACLQISSQTRILQGMIERGLVTRTPSATDRRKQILALTDAGCSLIDTHRETAADIARRYRDHLGDQRYRALFDALQRLDDL